MSSVGFRSAVALTLLCLAALGGCDLFVSTEGRVARAQEYIKSGNYPSAVIELKNALESDPDHVAAHLLLAQASLHLGDAPGADKELRRAREAGAPPEMLASLAAQTRLALGQERQLLAQIESRELPLAEPELSIYRGQAQLALGQAEAAAESFERVQTGGEPRARATVGLARARAMQGNTQESLRLLATVPADSAVRAEALLAVGQILASQGRFADARRALQAAFDARNQLTILQQGTMLATLTEASLAAGDMAAARQHFQLLAELAPNAPITLLLGARIAMAAQDYAGASAALQRVVVSLPDFAPGRFLLGAALVAQGNLNQAESHLTRAVQMAPENLEGRKLLAQVRLRMGQPDAVLNLLTPLQADADADVNTLLGLAHLQLGQSAAGLSEIERGAANRPADRDRQLDLAATYLQAREFQKAIALLRSLPHVEEAARRESLLIAAVAASEGLPASDLEINKLLEQFPRDVALLNAASVFMAQRGEIERARVFIGRALAVKSDDPATALNSARIEYAAGNFSAAKARLQGVVASHPENEAALLGLAELAVRENNLRAAAATLEPLRARAGSGIAPRLALARIYLMDRRTQDAAAVFAELERLANGNAEVVNTIGTLYLERGRYDEAGASFKRAIDLDGDNAQYWLNQARTHLALDRRGLARESLERALAVRPDSVMVVAALAMLDVRDGKPAAGAQRISALQKAHPDDPAVLALQGDFYAEVHDYESASRAFDAALTIRPSATISVRSYYARREGKLRDALGPLESWVDKHPDDFAVQAVLAEAYVRGGQRSRALEKYELIVDKGPANALVLNNLAWLYYESDDVRAETIAYRAFRMAPANLSIADTYGWILVERNKVAEGLRVLENIESRGGPDIKYHYAAALARSGDLKGARQRLKPLVEGEAFDAQGDARRLLQELSTR